LALAARELVWVAVAKGGSEADRGKRPLDPGTGVAEAVDCERLGQRAIDGVTRVQ
jgi:hypothetical protein